MSERELGDRFERHRQRLLGTAYRMLGSLSEAEDAVQETWLRLQRSGDVGIENLGGWLTTVVSRVCLDALRTRAARRELLAGRRPPDRRDSSGVGNPEREAMLAESVGHALLVVLDRLTPPERVAFVLHDVLGLPFEEIAPIVERSAATAKKLASRARRRVRGTPVVDAAEIARQRRVAEAFLAAARDGDVEAILAVLTPDVIRRSDVAATGRDRPAEVRGARRVSEEIAAFGRAAGLADPVLIDGVVGAVVAPRGRIRRAIVMSFDGERIAAYELISDPGRLGALEIAVLALT